MIPIVLVVEDDFSLQYLAMRQLKKLGFQCDVAKNGAEALQQAKNKAYAMIFMDVQMPIMSGLEASREIRKYEADSHCESFTPIVAMTANPEKQRCFDAGMNDFMFKPITLAQMQNALDKWVSGKRQAT